MEAKLSCSILKVCGAENVGSTPTASANEKTWEIIITCSHCKEQIFANYDVCTHRSRNDTHYFYSKTCKYEWLLTTDEKTNSKAGRDQALTQTQLSDFLEKRESFPK